MSLNPTWHFNKGQNRNKIGKQAKTFQKHPKQTHFIPTTATSSQRKQSQYPYHLHHHARHFALQTSQHRHNIQEKARKHVPSRFNPLPPHLTPSTSRSRRTQLTSLCSCDLSARRPAAACSRPISSRCYMKMIQMGLQSLWQKKEMVEKHMML